MVTLTRSELTETCVIYAYYPEDDHAFPGIVCMDFKSEQPEFIQVSEKDTGRRYGHHAVQAIQRCMQKNEFPLTVTVAWY